MLRDVRYKMMQVRIRAKTPRDAKIAKINLVTMASLRPLASLREPAFADAMSARPQANRVRDVAS